MRVGVIGCGGMGTVHNNALKELSKTREIEVTALADCRPEFLEKAAALWPNAQKYTTGMELLENAEIELVHICLPSYLHTEHAMAAMDKGIAVMVEKPVCLIEEDAVKLLEKQKQTGAKVMVGQVVRSFNEYCYLKEAYESQKYGKLKSIVMQRLGGDTTWGFEDWFHDPAKSGSVVLDLHVHDVDFLRYMLGEPDEFHIAQATAFDSGMVNQIVTAYRFGDVQATAEGVWDRCTQLEFEASFRACFEKATMVFNSRIAPLTVYCTDGTTFTPQFEAAKMQDAQDDHVNLAARGPYYDEIQYFVDCLMNNTPNEIAPLTEGIASVRLALKEYTKAVEACI
ncbi:MAG: Gfo/Idh/MocA family oxidoreductase [Ruthenibacterium sp.]